MIGLLGGTPGKLVLGLRITRDDGATTPPGLQLGALRVLPQVAAQIPFIGWIISIGVTIASLVMVSQDPERRSVYDRLAGTRVVYKRSLDAASNQ